jgi:hypothetical protein
MPRWVGVPEWIIVAVAVAVECLGIARPWHDGVGGGEAADGRVVGPPGVPIEAATEVLGLAGEAPVGMQVRGSVASLAKGAVAQLVDRGEAGVGDPDRAAQIPGQLD